MKKVGNNHRPKKETTQKSYKSVFFKTQIIMLLTDLIMISAASAAVYYSDINLNFYFYFAISAFAVSSFIGGYYSGIKIHEKGLITGLLFCLPTNIAACVSSLAVNCLNVDITFFIALAVVLICSMLGGVLSVNKRLKAKSNRKGRQA